MHYPKLKKTVKPFTKTKWIFRSGFGSFNESVKETAGRGRIECVFGQL
jgi:hypothetical protein